MSEALRICHDRLLPGDQLRPHHTIPAGDGSPRAIIVARKLWVNGSRLRVRFLGGTPAQQAKARDQAAWWTAHANLAFDFNNAPDAEIRIAFNSTNGAWSYIGTDSQSIPRDQPTMNLGFLDGGTAAHEFGHAIGLAHEHQNPRGGIEWNEEAVLRDLSGPPNNWSPAQIRHNVLEKYAADQIRGTDFDPHSIMLYFFPSTWVRSGRGTQANDSLSDMDKAFIAGSQAYPRTPAKAVELRVNAGAVQASIGKPGEEDLYVFQADAAARYRIETGGQTDVVMKLYGPDSQTNLIDEDDDDGEGKNARIVTELMPGRYFIQIRHYNRTRGTGSYSIGVGRR